MVDVLLGIHGDEGEKRCPVRVKVAMAQGSEAADVTNTFATNNQSGEEVFCRLIVRQLKVEN